MDLESVRPGEKEELSQKEQNIEVDSQSGHWKMLGIS